MINLNINKGFEAMLPKPKQKKEEALHNHVLKFRMFKREFEFSFKVNKVKE